MVIKMPSKAFICAMLALVLFVPGAYGLSLGFSGRDAGSSFSDSLTIDAKVEESVNVLNVMKGRSLGRTPAAVATCTRFLVPVTITEKEHR